MKTAIVTGANGFAGTAPLQKLSAQGVEIYADGMSARRYIGSVDNAVARLGQQIAEGRL